MLNILSFQPLEIISQIHEGHSSNDKCCSVYLNERASQERHIKEGLSFLDKWKLLLNSKLRTVNQSYSLVPHCPQKFNVGTQTTAVLPCSRSSSHGTRPNVTVSTSLSAAPCLSVTNALSQYLYHRHCISRWLLLQGIKKGSILCHCWQEKSWED
jgi:hypothetical protein